MLLGISPEMFLLFYLFTYLFNLQCNYLLIYLSIELFICAVDLFDLLNVVSFTMCYLVVDSCFCCFKSWCYDNYVYVQCMY